MTRGRARPAARHDRGRRPAVPGVLADGPVEAVDIERVVAGGDGLARQADGRVVFVPGALPGERVDVRIVSAKRDFARGALVAIIDAHADRTTPPCPALARGCGGCDWQHAAPGLQAEMKAEIVREALRRTGRIADPQVDVAGAVPPWAYRTTMRFAIDREGRPSLHRARSDDAIALDDCLVAHPRLAEILPGLRVEGTDEITLRVSASTGDRTALCAPGATLRGLPPDVRVGADATIMETVAGTALRVSAASFFQSGPDAAEVLVATVRAACSDVLGTARTVIDAYGGISLFGATLTAGRSTRIVLVESSVSACADAVHNLAGRDADVVCSTVEAWTPVAADLVIADPARQGVGSEAVDVLVATGARTIVLVSCDPVSMARDTVLLRAAGFEPSRARVLDLFPQTHHVEVVTRFDRS